jgi:site-specific DNA-methyltransferase (adenine-specific)
MGKQWDGGDIAFRPEVWAEVLRVLKPGGHLVAFSGTRTYHRMACAIEDAGFEIRDQIGWCYGSGFPKSHDVSKGIDRMAGAEREVVGVRTFADGSKSRRTAGMSHEVYGAFEGAPDLTAPATDAAKEWQGWGTALKPAWEPIVLARKPLSEKTVAANVLRWGTGGINVDGCRVEAPEGSVVKMEHRETGSIRGYDGGLKGGSRVDPQTQGRWPANLIHDGSEEVVRGFPSEAGSFVTSRSTPKSHNATGYSLPGGIGERVGFGDSGSAARFFYCAKA